MIRSAILPLILLTASVVTPAARKDAKPILPWVPDESVATALYLDGATWIAQAPGFSMRLTKLTEDQRQEFVRRTTDGNPDPFISRPGEEPRFLAFLLEMENRSDDQAVFQPQNSWLMTPNNQILYPAGVEELRARYRMADSEMPQAYEGIGRALVEGARTLFPGDKFRGLLVYRNVKPRTKQYAVTLQLMLGSGNVLRFDAPYRRLKKKELP